MQNGQQDLSSASRLWVMNREISINSRKRETGMETGGERYRRMSTAIPVYTLEQQEMHGVCYL